MTEAKINKSNPPKTLIKPFVEVRKTHTVALSNPVFEFIKSKGKFGESADTVLKRLLGISK